MTIVSKSITSSLANSVMKQGVGNAKIPTMAMMALSHIDLVGLLYVGSTDH